MEREKKLLLILAFNLTLMALEVVGGIVSRSLALLSDAGHMLTDSLAVFLSYLAIHWSRRPADHRKTFGYHRAEILVALANGVALLLIAGYIFYEAILRFFNPQEIKTGILLAIAAIGLAGNPTLFKSGIVIGTAEDAAMALKPLAGEFAKILFAVGLVNASLFAATILPLSTTYTICEGMGWESGVNKEFSEAPQFMGLYTGLILFSGGLILIPGAPLIKIMLVSQVVNGVLLPFVLIFILLLINKKDLMGAYVNGRINNWVSWASVVVLIGLSIALIVLAVRQMIAG